MKIPKFRAWRKNVSTMVNVDTLYWRHNEEKGETLTAGWWYTTDFSIVGSADEVSDEFILMKSTGLIDENGVEIFEGDILYYPENKEDSRYGVVVWQELTLSFDLQINHLGFSDCGSWKSGVVVGNIYENPELRKELE